LERNAASLQAAVVLAISERQTQRWLTRYRDGGGRAISLPESFAQTVQQVGPRAFLLILAVFASGDTSLARSASETATVEIIKVYDPPEVWAGVVDSDQWLDVTVRRSWITVFKRGDRVHIGTPIVGRSPPFEANEPRFSAAEKF
jgi:hypothetical protein